MTDSELNRKAAEMMGVTIYDFPFKFEDDKYPVAAKHIDKIYVYWGDGEGGSGQRTCR